MSDDLDFDMEVVGDDELNELSGDAASSSEEDRPHSGIEETGRVKHEHRQVRRREGSGSESEVTSSDGKKQVFEKDGKVEGWKQKTLGSIFNQIYSGGTPKKGVAEYYGGDLPFVKIEDLNRQQGRGISTAEVHITEKAVEETSTRAFQPGTLLLTIYGSLAETALVHNRVATNQAILGLWEAEEENTLYAKYAIDYDQSKLQSLSRQTTQANLGKGIVAKHRLSVPPLPEQRKIASVLYAVDQAIQKTEEIIEQAERTKLGVAQDLFHSGIGDHGTKETWLGVIPASWRVVQFSEIVQSTRNGLYKSRDSYGRGYPIAKMGNALDNRVLNMEECDRLELTESEKKKYRLESGDLIFARRAQEVSGAGHCTLVPELDEQTVFESSLIRVRLSEDAIPMFYAQYFEGPVGSRAMKRIVTETSISGIATSDLLNLDVPVPRLDEQEKIASTLSSYDEQVRSLKKEVNQLKWLKRGLMQDLLTGEVRTADRAIEVLEEVQTHG